ILAQAAPGAVAIVTQVWPMEWLRQADTSRVRLIGMSHESYAYTRACHRYRWVKENYPHVDRWLVLTQEDADDWITLDGMQNVGAMPNALAHLPE
ncbi:glycosyl transferase, partial [Streptomyces sp. 4F]